MDKPVFRVGDVVCIDTWEFVVKEITHNDVLIAENGARFNPSYCTLLHRPFQFLDDCEYYDEAAEKWIPSRFLSDCFVDKEIRHLNPLYRTHKDYNPTNPTKEV